VETKVEAEEEDAEEEDWSWDPLVSTRDLIALLLTLNDMSEVIQVLRLLSRSFRLGSPELKRDAFRQGANEKFLDLFLHDRNISLALAAGSTLALSIYNSQEAKNWLSHRKLPRLLQGHVKKNDLRYDRVIALILKNWTFRNDSARGLLLDSDIFRSLYERFQTKARTFLPPYNPLLRHFFISICDLIIITEAHDYVDSSLVDICLRLFEYNASTSLPDRRIRIVCVQVICMCPKLDDLEKLHHWTTSSSLAFRFRRTQANSREHQFLAQLLHKLKVQVDFEKVSSNGTSQFIDPDILDFL